MTETDSSSITERQWDLVCYIEEFWCERKKFPTYAMILANVKGFRNESEMEAELYSRPVKVRLDNRGVNYAAALKKDDPEYRNPSRLSDKQLAVINTLLNPFDRRSQTKKLAELGISVAVANGWMKDKRYRDYYNARAEELFGPEGMPLAHEALMRKVSEGNLGAIKLYYEVSGRHTGVRKEEIANLKLLFAKFTEIIQKYVSPDNVRLIVNELNLAMLNTGSINVNEMASRSPVAEIERDLYGDDDTTFTL